MRRPWLPLVLAAGLLTGACTGGTGQARPLPSRAPSAAASTVGGVPERYAAGVSSPVADPVYPGYGNPGIDVLHYGLALAWRPETRTLTGTATIQLRAAAALGQVRLDFSKAYTVDGATLDGAPAAATLDGAKLTVAGSLAEDRVAELVVRYHGTPTTIPMPSHRGDAEALGLTVTADGALWTMQEPYGAGTWYPANDQPSDKALYDIAVTVPEGWSAIASGTPAAPDGTTFRYSSATPVAAYLTTLAVGHYTHETASGPGGVALSYWYRPGPDDRALPYLRKSPQYLDWLAKRFGAYPFDTGGVLMVPSASGMETQQMITMGLPGYGSDAEFAAGFDGDLLHEYAHQWFGDAVTTSNWNDLWLNEGWAEYAQLLYTNERDGVSDKQFEDWARGTDARLRQRLGPPGRPRADSFAESNVYICPALMLHELHEQLGDTAFFALAADWAHQHKGTAQDRAAFIAFVNRHTGRDFTAFINTWLDSATTPQ